MRKTGQYRKATQPSKLDKSKKFSEDCKRRAIKQKEEEIHEKNQQIASRDRTIAFLEEENEVNEDCLSRTYDLVQDSLNLIVNRKTLLPGL